jgi:uncharacterized protein
LSNSCDPKPPAPLETAPNLACCGDHPTTSSDGDSAHCHDHTRFDWLLWGSLSVCFVFYTLHLLSFKLPLFRLAHFSHSVFELLNTLWWGVLVGIIFVGILAKIPQQLILSALGQGGTLQGIARATCAGIFFDLCSHGILMVGMKLYQKGASLGQVMAFLIASPWNSFSLTFIMVALIGLPWTLTFIGLSLLIALISGTIFDYCVKKGMLPINPHTQALPEHFHFSSALATHWQSIKWQPSLITGILREGLSGARMVLRWLLFGVILAALIRTFISLEIFQQWFGPTLIGLTLTLMAATVIEVCSEGSTPIAADIMNRAQAPGNSFTFLMAGVSTDYTEVMAIKDTTHSWKIALFLPLITLPQILVLGYLLNL